ncbi:MAG TPA: hypothetical protein VNA24_21585 [Hyalangium sp.]|nr:hypothetical protein [Hyalangium sp.]
MTNPSPSPSGAVAGWSLALRVAFRFVFAYLFIYIFVFPAGVIPGTRWISNGYTEGWNAIIPWVGKHLLRLSTDITVQPNGSGDTTYNYVQVLCYLVLAAVAAIVWSVVDRRRTQYARAHDFLRIYVRYSLAMTMLSYGFAKVFKMQFPFPSAERLMQPFGDSSPMGLLWTFMGYSTGYNLFTGGAEVLGGLLLLFRRTTTLGALVVIGVMSNVVALNFFYDVPVKLYSSHLLLMGVFLLSPDLRRLANVLVLNRPTEAVVLRTPFQRPWLERGSRAVKVLFAGWIIYSVGSGNWEGRSQYGDAAPRHALYGVYEVESFTRNGEVLPLLAGDATAWRNMMVGTRGRLAIRFMNGTSKRFRMKDDAEKKTLSLSATSYPGEQDTETAELTWSQPDPEHLTVEGSFRNATIHVRLKKLDESKFLLVNRGFNWIQEYPFNR